LPKDTKNKTISYKDAGVDIEAGEQLINRIKPFANETKRKESIGGLGGFGSLFEIPEKFKKPVLVSGTDGVGTKLKLAFDLNKHETIGQDLVAMCVNDILVQGAEPLFFLDYYACGKLDVDTAATIIKGIAAGCLLANCSLVGGETAEMPGMYDDGEYDLAGFCVGAVEKNSIINGSKVKEGNLVLGLTSSGAHSNGYSLIRKIISHSKVDLNKDFYGEKLSDVLMKPTKIYVKSILSLIEKINVHAMAHITGGGIMENLPRVLPVHLCAKINKNSWELPHLFQWLKDEANLDDTELYKTFNCGIGMAIIIDEKDAHEASNLLRELGEEVHTIGRIEQSDKDEHQVEIT
jgi:phosphoribosylformylglycinamidine cyclo-ligase|tara:strand:+ start:600 stop:1646 length:1047 start_codon:yes stop_codon:yes gene_type:complete